MKNIEKYNFSTKAIHAGEEPNLKEGGTGDVVVPIHLSTTFAREKVDIPTQGYDYTRSLNPTRKALEEKLAAIENAAYGLAFSSGLSAITTVLLSLLKSGDHILASDDLYGGTKRLFNQILANLDFEVSYVDTSCVEKIEESIKDNTRLVWIESPTNPLLKLTDIKAASEISHKHNLLVVVDNTFLSPYFQNPLNLGADLVVHSSTKYIGGHSDVLGGSVMLSDDNLFSKIQFYQNSIGAVLSPFDSYLTLRGIKTLELRMHRHNQNALQIAGFLENHPKIKKVYYPGLKSHPQHELANRQSRGFGGIISFETAGTTADAKRFLEHLQIFAVAESLGGVESLIELPAIMTHASVPVEDRRKLGISDTLVRLSVGIEDINDLLADLKQALE